MLYSCMKFLFLCEIMANGSLVLCRAPQEMSHMLAELQQRHDIVVEEKGRLVTRSPIPCLVCSVSPAFIVEIVCQFEDY